MRGWILPVAACSFGAGVIVLGERIGSAGGLGAAAAGVFLLAASIGRRHDDALAWTALIELPSPGARERILHAAGIGVAARSPPSRISSGRWVHVAAIVAGFFFIGAGWSAVRGGSAVALEGVTGRHGRFHGTAASDPRSFDFGWGLEVIVDRAEVDERTFRFRARAWVRGSAGLPPVEAGQPVSGTGILRPVEPGRSGFEDYLIRRGIRLTWSVPELSVLGPAGNPALRAANAARRGLRHGATLVLPEREGGLLLGLSVGDLSGFDPEVEEDFRATGLGHLVAVSGSNVVMFLAPVLAIGALFRVSAGARFALGVGAVGFFALLTRWEPSVLRASVMAVVVLLGALAGRPRSTGAALGGTVLVLLVADPALAASLGFQLSVAATAGIAGLAFPLAARMPWLPGPLAVAVAATIGAQIAVTPLLLLAFGTVPTVTLVANVLAFPAVPAALFAGLVAAGAALLWEPLGLVLGKVAAVPLGYLLGLADVLARSPLPSIAGGGLLLPIVIAVGGIVVAWRLRRGRRRLATGLALAVTAGFVWAGAVGAGPPTGFVVTFLDVGQGDAALVRAPDGTTILIDAGGDEHQVASKLAPLGVKRIDLAIATHAHLDHIGGFPAVFSRYPVGTLLEPGCPADSPHQAHLLEAVAAEGIPVQHPRGGDRLRAGLLQIEVLGPDRCTGEPNNDSIVLRVVYQESEVLFTGDAEVPSQEDLLEDADPIAADILKVPHHGGDTSLEVFFQQVGADVAIVSVGENDYGHPVESVLAALRRTGAHVIRTDRAGDITVQFTRDGLRLESAAD